MSTGCTSIKASAFLLESRNHIRSICYDFGSAKIYLWAEVSHIFAVFAAFYNVLIMVVFGSAGCSEIISSFKCFVQILYFVPLRDF